MREEQVLFIRLRRLIKDMRGFASLYNSYKIRCTPSISICFYRLEVLVGEVDPTQPLNRIHDFSQFFLSLAQVCHTTINIHGPRLFHKVKGISLRHNDPFTTLCNLSCCVGLPILKFPFDFLLPSPFNLLFGQSVFSLLLAHFQSLLFLHLGQPLLKALVFVKATAPDSIFLIILVHFFRVFASSPLARFFVCGRNSENHPAPLVHNAFGQRDLFRLISLVICVHLHNSTQILG